MNNDSLQINDFASQLADYNREGKAMTYRTAIIAGVWGAAMFILGAWVTL